MTKVEVFQQVLRHVQSLGGGVQSIDDELLGVLRDISSRSNMIFASDTITTAAGTRRYAVPDNFKQEIELAVDGGNRLQEISFDRYTSYLDDNTPVNPWDAETTYDEGDYCTHSSLTWVSTAADNLNNTPASDSDYWDEVVSRRGEPEDYALFNGYFYFWPCPDAVYTINHHYALYHPTSLSTIYLGDPYRETVVMGVLAALFSGQLARMGVAQAEYAKFGTQYEIKLRSMQRTEKHVARSVRYRDL